MKVMILPNNSILEYVRFFYYLPLDIYCEIKNSNNQNYSIRINFYYQNNLIYRYSPTKTHFLIRMHSKSRHSIQTQLTF